MITRDEYRSAKVRYHASILEAESDFAKSAEEKVKPDEYREQHGKCPRGFRFDEGEQKCVPSGEGEEAPPGEPEEKPKKKLTPEQQKLKKKLRKKQIEKKEREKESPEKKKALEEKESKKKAAKQMRDLRNPRIPMKEKQALLDDLANKNWDAYQKEVERLRETGELPDRDTAELMMKIKDLEDLPEEWKTDKNILRERVDQQQALREHKKRVVQKQLKYLENFEENNRLAEERGEQPQKLNLMKMMADIEKELGAPPVVTPIPPKEIKEAGKILSEDEGALRDILKGIAPKPGSRASRARKVLDRIFQPLPDLSPFWEKLFGARSSFEGDIMLNRIMATLDDVAEELERRGDRKLASLVDAEASGLPEADKLPDGEKSQPWDEDWTQQTSDYREDLGYPPYDKVRPRVKGDEAED